MNVILEELYDSYFDIKSVSSNRFPTAGQWTMDRVSNKDNKSLIFGYSRNIPTPSIGCIQNLENESIAWFHPPERHHTVLKNTISQLYNGDYGVILHWPNSSRQEIASILSSIPEHTPEKVCIISDEQGCNYIKDLERSSSEEVESVYRLLKEFKEPPDREVYSHEKALDIISLAINSRHIDTLSDLYKVYHDSRFRETLNDNDALLFKRIDETHIVVNDFLKSTLNSVVSNPDIRKSISSLFAPSLISPLRSGGIVIIQTSNMSLNRSILSGLSHMKESSSVTYPILLLSTRFESISAFNFDVIKEWNPKITLSTNAQKLCSEIVKVIKSSDKYIVGGKLRGRTPIFVNRTSDIEVQSLFGEHPDYDDIALVEEGSCVWKGTLLPAVSSPFSSDEMKEWIRSVSNSQEDGIKRQPHKGVDIY